MSSLYLVVRAADVLAAEEAIQAKKRDQHFNFWYISTMATY